MKKQSFRRWRVRYMRMRRHRRETLKILLRGVSTTKLDISDVIVTLMQDGELTYHEAFRRLSLLKFNNPRITNREIDSLP